MSCIKITWGNLEECPESKKAQIDGNYSSMTLITKYPRKSHITVSNEDGKKKREQRCRMIPSKAVQPDLV